jgi:arylsulfatase
MHWPARIQPRADWYREPAQLIDLMPTLIEVTGGAYPPSIGGRALHPLEGISLSPAFDGKALGRQGPIFVEHENNAFVRDGDWKLVGRGVSPPAGLRVDRWELYQIRDDGTELNDLAASKPDKVEALSRQWEAWAGRTGVYPKTRKPSNPKAGAASP